MREIWAVDCETDPFKKGRIPEPFIWGAYCLKSDEYLEFETGDALIDYFLERGKPCVFYAHNGGKFDWHFLLHRLEPWHPLMVISGRLAKFKIGCIEFRDSYNILPVPLAAYQKTEISYDIFEKGERDKPKNRDKIRAYLRDDCVFLAELIEAFISQYGSQLTLASSAMKQWRKISGLDSPKTNGDFYEEISPYYYGGRVQCFKTGEINAPFSVIDINSAYPYAMQYKHPWGNQYEISKELPENGIEKCFIKLRARSKGAFPFRENGLIFPRDNAEREFTVSGWEYLAAMETGALSLDHEIISVIRFFLEIDFKEYIDHFYALKASSKKGSPDYIFAKLFLNSLYGKFGANPDKYAEYTVIDPQFIEAAKIAEKYEYAGDCGKWALMSRDLEEHKQRFFNVAVAASITGFVRAYLWRAISKCEGVIYCDTDSIACAGTGALKLDPTELGAWDVEAECDYGAVAGKKLYAFRTNSGDWKTATKGVRLSAEEIVRVAKGETVVHEPDAPTFSLSRGKVFTNRKIKLTG